MDVISIGVMEQKAFRKEEELTPEEECIVEEILGRVGHVEFKYLDSVLRSLERVRNYGGEKSHIIHAQYPFSGEGSLNLVDPGFREKLDPKGFRGTVELLNPPWFSVHLGFSVEKQKSGGQFDFDVANSMADILPEDVVFRRIVDGVVYLQDAFNKPVLVENLDYNPIWHNCKFVSGAYEHVTRLDFIRSVVEEADCGILLDVGHAEVSARNMPYPCDSPDALAYIEPLIPHVVEVHMSGPGTKNDLAHDSHRPINEEGQKVVDYLEFILQNRPLNLRAVTLETFNETGLVPQLDLLEETIRKAGYETGSLGE